MKSLFKNLVLLNVGMGSDRPFLELCEDRIRYEPDRTLKKGDLLVFEGGVDISPRLYGERPHPQTQHANNARDIKEAQAFHDAVELGIPMIGICRGAQLFTALLGGKLIQHVNGHLQDHQIITNEGKLFHVTSCHHQMMVPTGIKHELLGWSNGVSSPTAEKEPEIVFYPEVKALAIQAHPEWMSNEDPFVAHCRTLVSNLLT